MVDTKQFKQLHEQRLKELYELSLQRLNAYCNLFQTLEVGPDTYRVRIPEESIDAVYWVTKVDPLNFVIGLKPVTTGATYIRDITQLVVEGKQVIIDKCPCHANQ